MGHSNLGPFDSSKEESNGPPCCFWTTPTVDLAQTPRAVEALQPLPFLEG